MSLIEWLINTESNYVKLRRLKSKNTKVAMKIRKERLIVWVSTQEKATLDIGRKIKGI
jgi:hypothetical protein